MEYGGLFRLCFRGEVASVPGREFSFAKSTELFGPTPGTGRTPLDAVVAPRTLPVTDAGGLGCDKRGRPIVA
jgi:hypothetical protein